MDNSVFSEIAGLTPSEPHMAGPPSEPHMAWAPASEASKERLTLPLMVLFSGSAVTLLIAQTLHCE
jgi:hypothetical protein